MHHITVAQVHPLRFELGTNDLDETSCLGRSNDLILEHLEEFALLESLDNCKPSPAPRPPTCR
jgi:hypothetical protein